MEWASLLWLAISAALILRFGVFRPRTLREAPVRHAIFSMGSLAGVVLLYVGVLILALGFTGSAQPARPPLSAGIAPSTHPASIMRAPTASKPSPATPTTSATAAATTSAPATTASAPSAAAPAAPWGLIVGQAADAVAKLASVLLIFFLVHRLVAGGFEGWGLSWRQLPRGVLLGILGWFIIFPWLVLVSSVCEYIVVHVFHTHMGVHETLKALETQPSFAASMSLFLLAAIAAPVLEEIFFRGLLQTMLCQPGWGFAAPRSEHDLHVRPSVAHRWAAILIVSAIFAAAHLMPAQFPILFLLAIALGYLYERTGNLWACITLHATFNSVVMTSVIFGAR